METLKEIGTYCTPIQAMKKKVKANIESRVQSMGMGDYIFRVVVPEETEKRSQKW